MKLALATTVLVLGLIGLHHTGAGILIWHGAVEDLGEGGPAFGCFYLTTRGPVRVGYFSDREAGHGTTTPAGRSDCRWVCVVTEDVATAGSRQVTAWRCASDS